MELLTALGPVRRPGDSGITDRAWARKKAGLRGGILTTLGPVRRPGGGGNADRGADRAWAREKAGALWKFRSRRLPRLDPREGRGTVELLTALGPERRSSCYGKYKPRRGP